VNGNSVPPLLAYAIARQVLARLEEQQNISFEESRSVSLGESHLLDFPTLEASVDLRNFDSMGQHQGKLYCGASGLVGRGNIKVGNERSQSTVAALESSRQVPRTRSPPIHENTYTSQYSTIPEF